MSHINRVAGEHDANGDFDNMCGYKISTFSNKTMSHVWAAIFTTCENLPW